ncbi:MAG: hypothetical protein KDA37_14705 [Planctomycetales bacterium]|nr:hypothetical protein [Planctomycetales bacterium]
MPDHIAQLEAFPTEAEALIVVSALDAAGIKSTAVGGYTSAFQAEAPGLVQVMVAEEDLPAAKETLRLIREENAD